eukprot:TRINITY_DN4072_c0_g1_i1.p1 TRINITY_DN4072_c0_g1~~TRINITY_DN4072_c0_g1_i1.p1  ORF type:complete len:372 (-),score=126.44 TRINITY_DN4072_c0_g1_i1:71-1186(-)
MEQIAASVALTAWNLLSQLAFSATAIANGNVFISPLSIVLILALTQQGAIHQTSNEMLTTLNIPLDQQALYLEASKHILESLKSEHFSVDIANGIWLKEKYGFQQSFLDIAKNNFNAKLNTIEDAEKSKEEINKWVESNTKGKISNLIKEIKEDTQMLLINTVYFQSLFAQPFSSSLTHTAPFHHSDGSSKDCQLMTQTGFFSYFQNDKIQAIDLPYGDTFEGMKATVLVPVGEATVEDAIQELKEQWIAVSDKFKMKRVEISLPKFKVEYETNLDEALKNLGMEKAFSNSAQFDKMSTNPVGLKIGQVLHKTFVEVNEQGTEAASATAVDMRMKSAFISEAPVVMKADRPFVFLIRSNDLILFAGVIRSV